MSVNTMADNKTVYFVPQQLEFPPEAKGTVLIIDDNDFLRQTEKLILEKSRYKVMTAVDGQDGYEIYKNNKAAIDLIILDIVMPRLNGYECLKKIREISKSVPVIMVSGYDNERDVAMLDTISDYIHKPFSKKVLLQAVVKAVSEQYKLYPA